MEANKETLLEGRIFYKTSFNSSFNSSALSGNILKGSVPLLRAWSELSD